MEHTARLKDLMLNVTHELISGCRFCVQLSTDPDDKTPIHCVKFSGSSIPVHINAQTCLSCREYRKSV